MGQKKSFIMFFMAPIVIFLAVASFTSGLLQTIASILFGVSLIGFFASWFILWRCPHCGKFMSKISARRCPHCGKNIYE